MHSRPAAKKHFGRAEHVAATAFLHSIIEAADRLREAHAFDGSRALPLDPRYDLLRAIERCGGEMRSSRARSANEGAPPQRSIARSKS